MTRPDDDPRLAVLLVEPMPGHRRDRLEAEFPGVRFLDGPEPRRGPKDLSGVEVLFGVPRRGSLETADRLRWLHWPFAGFPEELARELACRGILFSRAEGVFARSTAEHALALMLALAKRIDVAATNRRERAWVTPIGPAPRDLAGATVGIFGVGAIGRALAVRCRALGMRVLGLRRDRVATPDVDRLFGPEELLAMASQSDWLVNAAPLTESTREIFDAGLFGAMPRGSFFVNVGRGGSVDDAALVAALKSREIAGAALDVADPEPPGQDSPLWTAPNLLLTAHGAGTVPVREGASADFFVRNLHRFVAGESLAGLVD